MPRGDGTGPMGMGSMTGRGAGNCIRVVPPGFFNQEVRFGRGMGAGRGLKRMFRLTGMPGWARNDYTPEMQSVEKLDEKIILKNQEDVLEKQLQRVKDRLKDFEEQK